MTFDLLAGLSAGESEAIGASALVLRGFALPRVDELLGCVEVLTRCSPFRRMVTPGGSVMSAALTNCGELGWVTDRRGYRYTSVDPDTGRAWPAMPGVFRRLAGEAAREAGFREFVPDACLVNHYLPGTGMSLHRDKDESDFSAPIVSVSLGMPAVFLFGGLKRADKAVKVPLSHGDVVVWGGEDRMRYHGIMPLKDDPHSLLGSQRINLTLRKAG